MGAKNTVRIKKVPMRQCTGCGKHVEKKNL